MMRALHARRHTLAEHDRQPIGEHHAHRRADDDAHGRVIARRQRHRRELRLVAQLRDEENRAAVVRKGPRRDGRSRSSSLSGRNVQRPNAKKAAATMPAMSRGDTRGRDPNAHARRQHIARDRRQEDPPMTVHGRRNRTASDSASSCVLSPISLTATSAKLPMSACQLMCAHDHTTLPTSAHAGFLRRYVLRYACLEIV
jgi:hypothetical protein